MRQLGSWSRLTTTPSTMVKHPSWSTKPLIPLSSVILNARYFPCVVTKVRLQLFLPFFLRAGLSTHNTCSLHPLTFSLPSLWFSTATGIALTLWNVLAGGHIRTDAEEEARSVSGEKGRSFMGDWKRNESEKKICTALEKVAEQVGAKHITAGASQSSLSPITLKSLHNTLTHARSQLLLPTPCTKHPSYSPSSEAGKSNIFKLILKR